MIYNNNKCHYIKKSMSRIKFQRKFTFPIRSAQRESIGKQWLKIWVEKVYTHQDDEVKYVFTPTK
jgi:hypothetical protein